MPLNQVLDNQTTLICDALFLNVNTVVLIIRTKKVVIWSFVRMETYTAWKRLFSQCQGQPKAVVIDGKRGLYKAVRECFPQAIVQRCQFHVAQYCLTRLTKKPQTTPAQELRKIVLELATVKSKAKLEDWLQLYLGWMITYHAYVKQKTYSETEFTPTGRKRWHYTHGRLHAVYSHLKRAIPHLFKYLLDPNIPNTTNHVEGGVNAQLRCQLRFHRGLSIEKQKVLVSIILSRMSS